MTSREPRLASANNDRDSEFEAGVIAELGSLGDGAIVYGNGLARMFGKSKMTIKRAVKSGWLPPPIRMFGQDAWTVGCIIRHVEARLDAAAKEAARDAKRVQKYEP